MPNEKELTRRRSTRDRRGPLEILFEDFAAQNQWASTPSPRIQIEEGDQSYTVQAEIPGVQEEDIAIQVLDHKLTVSTLGKERENPATHRFGSFKRAFRFRSQIDTEKAKASLDRGILTIELPKTASAVPRTLSLTPAS